VRVTIRRLHLKHTVPEFEDGDVVGSATEVEDGHGLVATRVLLVQPVGQRGCRGLIDDAQNLKARDLSCILRGLPLRVIEVGGNRDHGLRNFLAEVVLSGLLHLLKHDRRDLGGSHGLVRIGNGDLNPPGAVRGNRVGHLVLLVTDLGEGPTHEALDRENRVLRVGDRLPPRHLADQALPLLRKPNHGGRCPASLGVGDDHRLSPFHYGDHGVRGSEVNPDYLAHRLVPRC
jgi:hypothetical protein